MLWRPAVAIVDSDRRTAAACMARAPTQPTSSQPCTRNVLKPLAKSGAAVLAVDHLAKNADSRAVGPGGTAAKRRAIGGVSIRVKMKQPFTPGHGGSATLVVNKDRHGGLRAHCPVGDREPIAGTFKLLAFNDGVLEWAIYPPADGERNDDESAPAEDIAAIARTRSATGDSGRPTNTPQVAQTAGIQRTTRMARTTKRPPGQR